MHVNLKNTLFLFSRISFFLFLLSSPFFYSYAADVTHLKDSDGDDFASDCKGRCILSVDNYVEPVVDSHLRPLVVVTDLLGEEYYSKIEVMNESPYLWAVAHADQLIPGVYLITSTSSSDLFKKTLIIQAK